MEIMDKKTLRMDMRKRRESLTTNEMWIHSEQIAKRLIQSVIYKEHNHICVYEAFRNEVSCRYIIASAVKDHKYIYLPVTDKRTKTMEFVRITEDTIFREGNYGIQEPELNAGSVVLKSKALILMPGLAFDKKKHRLGYGGGYYDRYLAKHTEHVTAALCYSFQIVETLPYEEYDMAPDYIVTEKEIF